MKPVVLTLGLGLALVAGFATAQQPENAFIVIIDGLRDDEGFGAESLYLKHIWNDLRPLGTQETRFWDCGWTATTGGHTTILSGVRQVIRNNGGNTQDIRSFDPLMFEYYREHFNAPESACGVVFGKWGNVGAISDFGLEPAFGAQWQGFRLGDASNSADSTSSRFVHQAMDSLHPRLVLANLGDVDHYGHQDTFANYVSAIRVADSMVYEFYKHIQAIPPYTDTFYRDKTVLIITSDHGRHDDAHGSFKGHGNWDHGSRQVGFLALGPGIAEGRVVTDKARDQIDIVPTVAAMLGFPAPFAEGDVMNELFEARRFRPVSEPCGTVTGAVNLSDNAGFSRDPDICADRDNNLYCVWMDKTPGFWQVMFRKSTDGGATWGSAQALFNYPAADSQMWYARVAADDSVIVSGMGFGKHLNPIDSAQSRYDTTFIWYPWLATSADAGNTWTCTSLLDSSMGSYYAPVTVRNGRFGVAWWACGQFAWQSPRNGIFFNNRSAGDTWRSVPVRANSKQGIHVSMVDDGSNYHIAASAFQTQDFDIGYWRSTNGGDSWTVRWVVNDDSATPFYDYDPEMVVDDSGRVHIFWARKENSGGAWRVMYGRRDSTAGPFDTLALVVSSAGAWQPHAALKSDTIALVWTDYRDGNPEVYCAFSFDRGTSWTPETRLTYTPALTQHPRVVASPFGFFAVWQDLESGNWEVYGESLSPTVAVEQGRAGARTARPFPTILSRQRPLTTPEPGWLYSAAGRRVTRLRLGTNRLEGLAPGLYYFRPESGRATTKLVLTR
jgi:hypothetical protein